MNYNNMATVIAFRALESSDMSALQFSYSPLRSGTIIICRSAFFGNIGIIKCDIKTRGSKEPVIAHLTQSCFGKVWLWWQIPRGSNIKL